MVGTSGYVSEELTIVWSLLIVTVVATYFIQRHRFTLLPPSSSAMLLGIAAGIAARLIGLSKPLRFSPGAFFYALLPPIVFLAGFNLKKRQFFQNIGAILCFAVLGTFISALAFGLATYFLVLLHIISPINVGSSPFVICLMYGAAISSIDPVATLAVLSQSDVPPLLYNLVFGESVLNDAVAIVLFNSLYHYYDRPMGILTLPAVLVRFCFLAAGSLLVGVGVALACAFVLKRFQAFHNNGAGFTRTGGYNTAASDPTLPLNDQTQNPDIDSSTQDQGLQQQQQEIKPGHFDPTLYELAIVIMGSYLAYLVAEVVGMSGIVALFFTGICHSHYSYYNVSQEARVTLRRFFELAAFLCETFVFAYLGLQVATAQHKFDFGLFFSGVPLAMASRAANVFPCSRLVNWGRQYRLPRNLQKMLWAVGLRGAVAYGLVINMPGSHTAIETATLVIVVISTLVMGSATGPLLKKLDLEGKDDAELYGMGWLESNTAGESYTMTGGVPPRLEVSQRSELHERFKEFDGAVLKPLFGGRASTGPRDEEDDTETEIEIDRNNRMNTARSPRAAVAQGTVVVIGSGGGGLSSNASGGRAGMPSRADVINGKGPPQASVHFGGGSSLQYDPPNVFSGTSGTASIQTPTTTTTTTVGDIRIQRPSTNQHQQQQHSLMDHSQQWEQPVHGGGVIPHAALAGSPVGQMDSHREADVHGAFKPSTGVGSGDEEQGIEALLFGHEDE